MKIEIRTSYWDNYTKEQRKKTIKLLWLFTVPSAYFLGHEVLTEQGILNIIISIFYIIVSLIITKSEQKYTEKEEKKETEEKTMENKNEEKQTH